MTQETINESALPNNVNELILNAIDSYRNSGGEIVIDTQSIAIDSNDCLTNKIPPGQYVQFSITDSGVGINKEDLEKVFDPFFTRKEIGKGPGLGLALTHNVVKQNNGHISVISEINKGTTFTILVPEHQEEKRKEPRTHNEIAPLESVEILKGKNILIVDENEKSLARGLSSFT